MDKEEKAGPDQWFAAKPDQWLAANLKTFREESGLSQQALADRMRTAGFRFHQQTVERIESGQRLCRVGEGLALARCLNLSLEALTSPPEHVHTALEIRQAIGRLWAHRDDAQFSVVIYQEAKEELQALIDALGESDNRRLLSETLDEAMRVLNEPWPTSILVQIRKILEDSEPST